MTFFEMLGTVTSAVPVKMCPPIPLQEVYLLSNFSKRNSSTSRKVTDKQNHMTILILCRQHLASITVRLLTTLLEKGMR